MIGALRNRIELLTETRTDDGAGGASVAWAPGPEIWAAVTRLASARDLIGDRARRLKRIAATVRFRDDLTLGKHLKFDNDEFEVVSIESDDEKSTRLTLVCEEAA